MLLDLRFLRLGLGFPLLFCGLRHGIWSFRLRAYLVLILPGSGNLAPEKTTRLLAAVSHKELFGSFRGQRVEKPKNQRSSHVASEATLRKSHHYPPTFRADVTQGADFAPITHSREGCQCKI